ncbi:hypothetical protein JH26_02055 [Microvirga sp. BSC39]|nr:hypothetical protein JH26_02055 [Microvirga sp. BSC39]
MGRKVLIGLSAAAALAGLGLWLSSNRITEEDEALVGSILETRGAVVPFSQIYPEKWDHVCWLGDYSFPSAWILRLLPQAPSRLKFVPRDRWLDEGQRALVFVDSAAAKARVSFFDYRKLNPPDEPNCVARDRAIFRVETVEAPNLTYTKLVIPSD